MGINGERAAPYVFEPLPWDTAYFDVPSARLTLLQPLAEAQLSEALALAEGFSFLCIRNKNCDVKNARGISRLTNAFVADTNVQLQKQVCPGKHEPTDASITVRDCCPPSPDILAIASTAFHVSRFLSDETLKAKNGAQVYAEWVKNAFSTPGKFFLVSHDPGAAEAAVEPSANGFILFSVEGEGLALELIGVSERCQRRGLGEKLWRALETEAASRNCTVIHVGTQLNNMNALRFYAKMGCTLLEATQVYHWWKGDWERPDAAKDSDRKERCTL